MGRNQELYQEIIRLMEDSKPYKNPDFSLHSLADMLGSNRTSIWNALCDRGVSFTSLVNSYRTSEAVEIVMNPKNNDLSVEDVAFVTGFGSPRTMNRYLKKVTGFSAYELRRRMTEAGWKGKLS